MKYTLEFSEGVAQIRCLKQFDMSDGVDVLTELLDAPWRDDMSCLLILDEGSAFSPTRDDISTLTRLLDTILSDGRVRIAIVVTKIVHYGIGRVLEARADRGGGRVRVFLREEAARQWLGIAEAQAGR